MIVYLRCTLFRLQLRYVTFVTTVTFGYVTLRLVLFTFTVDCGCVDLHPVTRLRTHLGGWIAVTRFVVTFCTFTFYVAVR